MFDTGQAQFVLTGCVSVYVCTACKFVGSDGKFVQLKLFFSLFFACVRAYRNIFLFSFCRPISGYFSYFFLLSLSIEWWNERCCWFFSSQEQFPGIIFLISPLKLHAIIGDVWCIFLILFVGSFLVRFQMHPSHSWLVQIDWTQLMAESVRSLHFMLDFMSFFSLLFPCDHGHHQCLHCILPFSLVSMSRCIA